MPPLRPSDAESGFADERLRKNESDQGKSAPSQQLVALVASVSERAGGELLLRLNNGQSWVQMQKREGILIKPGETVSITRGVLGGYLLRSDSGVSMRVRQLQ